MYVPVGHGGVRAETRVHTLRSPSSLRCNAGTRERENELRERRKILSEHICELYELIVCTSPCTQHLGCPPSTRKKLRALLPCCSIKYVKRKYNYWLSGNIPHGIMRGTAFQDFGVI